MSEVNHEMVKSVESPWEMYRAEIEGHLVRIQYLTWVMILLLIWMIVHDIRERIRGEKYKREQILNICAILPESPLRQGLEMMKIPPFKLGKEFNPDRWSVV